MRGDRAQVDAAQGAAVTAITLGFSLLPTLLVLLSLFWLRGYTLDETEVDA